MVDRYIELVSVPNAPARKAVDDPTFAEAYLQSRHP
jgi:hypothetical protein